MTAVWCVWTEWGEYEQWSRDLRGIFATADLAEAHAAQLLSLRDYDVCEVIQDDVLEAVPEKVPYIEFSAHITPDGQENTDLGYKRGKVFDTWSNEIKPLDRSRLGKWSVDRVPDLYIDVVGSNEVVVRAEYERLLAEARDTLASASR